MQHMTCARDLMTCFARNYHVRLSGRFKKGNLSPQTRIIWYPLLPLKDGKAVWSPATCLVKQCTTQ